MLQFGQVLLNFGGLERAQFTMFGEKIIVSFFAQCMTDFLPNVRPKTGPMYDPKLDQCMTEHQPDV